MFEAYPFETQVRLIYRDLLKHNWELMLRSQSKYYRRTTDGQLYPIDRWGIVERYGMWRKDEH